MTIRFEGQLEGTHILDDKELWEGSQENVAIVNKCKHVWLNPYEYKEDLLVCAKCHRFESKKEMI